MKRRFPLVLGLVAIFFSLYSSSYAQTSHMVRPSQISIQVGNLDQSTSWYKEMLGFDVVDRYNFVKQKSKIAVMKLKDFYIELIQDQNPPASGQSLHKNDPGQCGFYKMGFLVTGFDEFYQALKQEHPDQVNSIINSEVSGYTYVELFDPDGTLIQIIASSKPQETRELRPYLIGVRVTDMESEINWYEQNLDFTFTRKWEITDKGIYVRQLYAEGFIIELQKQTSTRDLASEAEHAGTMKEENRGISKITFKTDNIQSLSESLKTHHSQLLQEITPKSSSWYTSFLVTEDAEKNMIQIIQ